MDTARGGGGGIRLAAAGRRAGRRPWAGLLALLTGLLLGAPAHADEPDPESLYRSIRESRLEPQKAVRVDKMFLQLGPAFLDFEEAVLFPATPVAGHPAEMVFMGKARLSLDPGDPIESDQLELFTDHDTLDVGIQTGVLVLTDGPQVASLLAGPPDPAAAARDGARAAQIFQAWRDDRVRRLEGVETGIYRAALGEPGFEEYAAVWAKDSDLGRFHYRVDPSAWEPVTLGQFIPREMSSKERYALELDASWRNDRGRHVEFALENQGDLDTWLSLPLLGRDGGPVHGHPGFAAEHYSLGVSIARISQDVTGSAVISARAVGREQRALQLELGPDLHIEEILGEDGEPLFHFRNGSCVMVTLREPVRPGYATSVTVRFAGSPLEAVGKDRWVLRDPERWYPRVGQLDATPHEMKFTWPKGLQLLASGNLVAEGLDQEGMQWERRDQPYPVKAVSFQLGEFRVDVLALGDLKVRFAIPRVYARRTETRVLIRLEHEILASLRFLQEMLGPLPLEELTIICVGHGDAQSLFGFVTLNALEATTHGLNRKLYRDARVTIVHEMAHQWWGHLVGWESYHDQWLGEAAADYFAMLYARRELGVVNTRGPPMRAPWPRVLEARTEDGRTVESVGPVVLGPRLHSSRTREAYGAVIYIKGALLLDMLSGYFTSEDVFCQLMGRIVEESAGRNLSTERFIAHLARLAGTKLDWFQRQYIYGTGIPMIRYRYSSSKLADGTWEITGYVDRDFAHESLVSAVQLADGRFDIRHSPQEREDDGEIVFFTPFQVEPASGRGQREDDRTFSGKVRISAKEGAFRITMDAEPKILWLDGKREVLAHFFDDSRHPQGRLLDEGMKQFENGELRAAEHTLRRALAAPPSTGMGDAAGKPKYRDEWTEVSLHLFLARLHLDQGRTDEAGRDVKAARARLSSTNRSFDVWLALTEARIGILQGDYEDAYKELNRLMLRKDRSDHPEGYLLLAIAAREVGEQKVMERAIRQAVKQGANADLLTESSAD